MPVLFKTISPAKFKVEAIRNELVSAVQDTVSFAEEVYGRTYKDFTTKPAFESDVKLKSGSIVGTHVTEDANYKRLNSGTKPHVIRPKRPGGFLAFNANFKSKTRDDNTQSRRGFSRPPLIFARKVNHPGFTPRNYTKKINKRSDVVFKRSVRVALKKGSNESGHSI